MQTARPIARVRHDWTAKRKVALFSLVMSILCVAMLVSKATKALVTGAFHVPFSAQAITQPQWVYASVAALLLLAALGAYAAYRDWKFRRLTGMRLRRQR